MKRDKYLIGACGIVFAAILLIGLTWMGTLRAIHAQRLENAARVGATLNNVALMLTEQINRQLLALDQTLQMFVTSRENKPNDFNLESSLSQALVLNGISRGHAADRCSRYRAAVFGAAGGQCRCLGPRLLQGAVGAGCHGRRLCISVRPPSAPICGNGT